jgi:hypothetical protein
MEALLVPSMPDASIVGYFRVRPHIERLKSITKS